MDTKILNWLDAITTKLQRKGYLLTAVYVWVAFLNLLIQLANQNQTPYRAFFIPMVGVVWGIWLYGSVRWAQANKDYPQSVRMMEKLNARVLHDREMERWWRGFMRYMSCFFIGLDIGEIIFLQGKLVSNLLDISAWIIMTIMIHLHGCFYLGPGHFAKDTQKEPTGALEGAGS